MLRIRDDQLHHAAFDSERGAHELSNVWRLVVFSSDHFTSFRVICTLSGTPEDSQQPQETLDPVPGFP
jgi:hypothetical protein